MSEDSGASGDGPHVIAVRPNDSLGGRGRIGLFLLIAVSALTVAAIPTARGYWPVMVFAGLELLAFGACLWWVQSRGRYREVIILGIDHVRVESGYGRPQRVWRFHRDWVRVEQDPPENRNHDVRLFLREGREQCEIGCCLTGAERTALGERLKGLLAAGARTQPE